MAASCPTTDKLRLLLAQRLGADEHQVIEAHVNACAACQQSLAAALEDRDIDHWRKLLVDGPDGAAPPTEADFLGPLKHAPATPASPPDERLERIGKYVIDRELGGGAFGKVYLGQDVEMRRPVAIKVPAGTTLTSAQAREQFLHEARSVARLRHANIVAVHDLGQDDTGRCYLVYEFIEGTSLADRLKQGPLPPRDAAALVAQVAEALHYAHLQGLFHRDIKPANVLLDARGKPFVTDFGIAVREVDLARERGVRTGTPAYMSPEQVRGEGHLIDGRTDIYSLGVLFYEALTGQRPFQAESVAQLYDLVLYREAKPPRMIDDAIPRELERICLKAMAKRITDRHTTAQDVADDLRAALGAGQQQAAAGQGSSHAGAAPVVPKGLRSFGPEDAEFFLRLLPGPHDREGLPESLKFWKARIESSDPESAFRVGLIHGPSGCGKTSLIRAGLLPRLGKSVVPIYVEALRDGTEDRLLGKLQRALRKVQASTETDLVSALAALRQGAGLEPGQKALIVLDQLEQWLLGHAGHLATSPLVAAMRQADGLRVQFLLMVRDDFWSASARLFDELEIPMDSESNLRMVDLFDPVHARRVLQFFGQAYECLPARPADIKPDQQAFVDSVAQGLSQDGKVISVRLSLFADMMKARPWTPQSLEAVGGTQGVGVKFLEETFSASTANAEHRQDEKPARALLAVLLPETGTEIKGQMRSRADLLKASGLEAQPARFERLLKRLDQELRIITPTEPPELAAQSRVDQDAGCYQLTHDYLVEPLREWLTRGKKATWQGRAELCLEERAAQWSRGHDQRYLPSFFEFVRIALGVPRRRQKPDQQAMMRAAGRRIGSVALLVLVALATAGWAAWELHGLYRARGLVQAICAATPGEADRLIREELPSYRRWAAPQLLEIATDNNAEPGRRMRASLACLPEQADYLADKLPGSSLEEFKVISKHLKPHQDAVLPSLWQAFRDNGRPAPERLMAGLALAEFAPESPDWTEKDAALLARRLVTADPGAQDAIRHHLRPISLRLRRPLQVIFYDPTEDAPVRRASAAALIAFDPTLSSLRRDPQRGAKASLEDLLKAVIDVMIREPLPGEFRQLPWELLRDPALHAEMIPILAAWAAEKPRADLTEKERIELGRRRALAAMSLIKLGLWEQALPAFQSNGDPESAMQFAVHARDLGLTAPHLVPGLDSKDDTVRLSCVIALGRFSMEEVAGADALVEKLQRWTRSERHSGVRAACAWLLSKWRSQAKDAPTDKRPPAFDAATPREWFTLEMNKEAMTFVVFQPGRFQMGSPEAEDLRQPDERRRWVRLTRPFALLDREITVREWQRFLDDTQFPRSVKVDLDAWKKRDTRKVQFREPDHPAYMMTWYEAVDYCRWLTLRAGMTEEDQCYVLAGVEEKDKLPIWRFEPERRGFRLPTEAEWEYAGRAGTSTTYSFGSDKELVKHFAVFLTNLPGQPYRQPLAGGTRPPNPRGLFDMHGNVSEWCHDWRYSPKGSDPRNPLAARTETLVTEGDATIFLSDPMNPLTRFKKADPLNPFTPYEVVDPIGPFEGSQRYYRGGCYDNYARHCRTACRISDQPAYHFAFLGFRVACTLPRDK